MKRFLLPLVVLTTLMATANCHSRRGSGETRLTEIEQSQNPLPGAEQPGEYLPLLEGKKVGLVVNHTAMAGERHLLDLLIAKKVHVVKVFAPEHGFRGEASAGEKVSDGKDEQTGVAIVSLYGENRKPSPSHLENIDVMVFDIQDVGCRFYTYLSTLCLVIEACAENGIPLIVLDRPNPNGDYVAGPVLEPAFTSFVGMVPVPVVHGCTMGEMAQMINGEKWHKAPGSCSLTVIKVKSYTHLTLYEPPVPPSPNLPNYLSVRLYPSLCFFEATSVSIGRGTPYPFQVIGGMLPSLGNFTFVPEDIPGYVNNPNNEGKTCYGTDLRTLDPVPAFTLRFFMETREKYPDEKTFLTSERWFNLLAGTNRLLKGIREGKSEAELTVLWKEETNRYLEIRRKYLLYPDFE
jgi:uncharacterized protein YbbC (DUF1343 family)